MGTPSRSGIAIHPSHPALRKEDLNLLLQAFGSYTDIAESMAFTLRAVAWCRDSIIAVMALKRTVLQMKRKGHAAVRALKGEPTIRTEDKIGKAPAVKKEQTLFFLSDILLKGFFDPP
jgi:hypothetical protein